jgi:hypothetical protein
MQQPGLPDSRPARSPSCGAAGIECQRVEGNDDTAAAVGRREIVQFKGRANVAFWDHPVSWRVMQELLLRVHQRPSAVD